MWTEDESKCRWLEADKCKDVPQLVKVLRAVPTRGVTNPLFCGSGSGTGIVTQRAGVGVAWIRIHGGIGSTIGISSFLELHMSNI